MQQNIGGPHDAIKNPQSPVGAEDFRIKQEAYQQIKLSVRGMDGNHLDVTQKNLLAFKLRTAEASVLESSIAADKLAVLQEEIKVQGKTGLDAAHNPEIVAKVTVDTQLQKSVLDAPSASNIIIADGYKPRGDSEKSLRERTNSELPEKFYIDNGPQAKNQLETNAEQHTEDNEYILKRANEAKAKPGFLRDAGDLIYLKKAEQLGLPLDQQEVSSKESQEIPGALEFTPSDTKYEVVKTQSSAERNASVTGQDAVPNSVYVNNFTPEEQEAAKAKWLRENPDEAARDVAKSAEQVTKQEFLPSSPEVKKMPVALVEQVKQSQARMEKIEDAIIVRREKSKENLQKMGLGASLAKGLEAWGKVRPGYKFALAVTLAGASVATGGMTSVLAKGLSAATFASRQYEKEIATLEKEGKEIKKGMVALKSMGYGILLALGTSQLFSLAGDAISAHSDKISHMMDGIKGFFSDAPVTIPDTPLMPIPDVTIAPTEAILSADPSLLEQSLEGQPDIALDPSLVAIEPVEILPTPEAIPDITPNAPLEAPLIESAPVQEFDPGRVGEVDYLRDGSGNVVSSSDGSPFKSSDGYYPKQ